MQKTPSPEPIPAVRRGFTLEQEHALLVESGLPGNSISSVAREQTSPQSHVPTEASSMIRGPLPLYFEARWAISLPP